MNYISRILADIDNFIWGPAMLILLVGTGFFLTIRLKFRPWTNLFYAIKSTLSKEARQSTKGSGDISPFQALTTALASTIGTGNIVGVATAMVAGGPGALFWMWVSAFFGLSTKFSECMLSIKYREVNEKGEMSGGPMYTMKKGIKNKKIGTILGWLFAFFAVIASFGIGNMTQANSISSSLKDSFHTPEWLIGIILTILVLIIIVGGIQNISKVSSIVVPCMALFYIIAGLIVIAINYKNIPSSICQIFKMAFQLEAVGGGVCGTITASMMNAMRFGIARGVFSNEAGMGSAAITTAAATTDNAVQQGYISMTGTFWDTIVVCTITGLCIVSSGVLGTTETTISGTYSVNENAIIIEESSINNEKKTTKHYDYYLENNQLLLNSEDNLEILLHKHETPANSFNENIPLDNSNNNNISIVGSWVDSTGNIYSFSENNTYDYASIISGASLTIAAFETALGDIGGVIISIGITLFAFSTIIGWAYNGEKAFEYIFKTHKYTMFYRIFFSILIFIGATTTLEIVWSFSDIANALMIIPNLICLLALSNVIAKDVDTFQKSKLKK
ncbi:MAG: sodium:alanine symporter family protein [Lachnospiraceae bacterium]|nr:sodium:alanine symporter family protein [Lachnospiraceae bacterium]